MLSTQTDEETNVDVNNNIPRGGYYYRLYCILFPSRLDISQFERTEDHVEKSMLECLPTDELLYSDTVSQDNISIYPHALQAYKELASRELSWQ